ncbi:MAG: hypothetical protein ACK5LS_04275 [Propioniciclava sp.]
MAGLMALRPLSTGDVLGVVALGLAGWLLTTLAEREAATTSEE